MRKAGFDEYMRIAREMKDLRNSIIFSRAKINRQRAVYEDVPEPLVWNCERQTITDPPQHHPLPSNPAFARCNACGRLMCPELVVCAKCDPSLAFKAKILVTHHSGVY